MKAIAILILLAFWALCGSSLAQGHLTTFQRIIRLEDGRIGLNLLDEEVRVTPKVDQTYYWLKSQSIHLSQGDFGGQLLNGEFVRFGLTNNLVEKGQFRKGLKDGNWKAWHNNGNLKELTTWRNGRKHGRCLRFDNEGILIEEITYRKGQENGVLILYLKDGQVDKIHYRNGEVVSETKISNVMSNLLHRRSNRKKKGLAEKKTSASKREKSSPSRSALAWMKWPFHSKKRKVKTEEE